MIDGKTAVASLETLFSIGTIDREQEESKDVDGFLAATKSVLAADPDVVHLVAHMYYQRANSLVKSTISAAEVLAEAIIKHKTQLITFADLEYIYEQFRFVYDDYYFNISVSSSSLQASFPWLRQYRNLYRNNRSIGNQDSAITLAIAEHTIPISVSRGIIKYSDKVAINVNNSVGNVSILGSEVSPKLFINVGDYVNGRKILSVGNESFTIDGSGSFVASSVEMGYPKDSLNRTSYISIDGNLDNMDFLFEQLVQAGIPTTNKYVKQGILALDITVAAQPTPSDYRYAFSESTSNAYYLLKNYEVLYKRPGMVEALAESSWNLSGTANKVEERVQKAASDAMSIVDVRRV